MRWRVGLAVLALPVLLAISLAHVPVRTWHRWPRERWPQEEVERTLEMNARGSVEWPEGGTPENSPYLRGEWVPWNLEGFHPDRRTWYWDRHFEHGGNYGEDIQEFVDWRRAWWQPIIALLIGGGLLAGAIRRDRRGAVQT